MSDSEGEEQVIFYQCKLCSGWMTSPEREQHRLMHKRQKLDKKSKQARRQQGQQVTRLEIPLPNNGGKLALTISVEHLLPSSPGPSRDATKPERLRRGGPRLETIRTKPVYTQLARYAFPLLPTA